MLIGIVSDTHDDRASSDEAVEALYGLKAERIIHAGDFHRIKTAALFANCGVPVDAVFGNCDSDQEEMAALLPGTCRGWRLLDAFQLPGQALLVHDLSGVPESEIASAALVVHGHTHSPQVIRRGSTLIVNPGECCGSRTGQRTFALLDTDTMETRIIAF